MEDTGTQDAPASASEGQEKESNTDASGFLSEADAQPQETAKTEAEQPATEPAQEAKDWFFDEGLKGDGDRPEYLLEKYQSVAEQAKAYNELQKKFGEFKGAPKDGYQLDIEGVDADDPMIKHFSDVFKDMNMSNEGFKKAVEAFVNFKTEDAENNIKREMEKLGPNGKNLVNETFNRLSRHLAPEEVKQVNSWMMTAEDIKLMNKVLAFEPKSTMPTANDISRGVTYESSKAIKAEMDSNFAKYKEDEGYRMKIKRRLHDALVREGKSTVPRK